MGIKFEKLNQFFERIKTIGFWQRIFRWSQIKDLSYEAYKEFGELENLLDRTIKEADETKSSIAVLKNDLEHLKSEKNQLEISYERQINNKEKEIVSLKDQVSQLTISITQLRQENTIFKQTESDRKTKYDNDVAGLNAIREQIQKERQKEIVDRHESEIKRIESMKETWAKHQERVKQAIKMVCQKHAIEYVEKVPFKGSPDNTIKLCDEFIIFDAKSPSSDDLQNFPTYIKIQTESVKKYIKEDNVRKDIYLVIPSNTVDVIEMFSYNMADYNVYVVTLDVLEPLILSLKRIEEYEFVNELSPEERENICRIIGKFAHMTKRRIQIDHFFAWEFLDILTKCKADLPKEVLEKVIEFEKAEKLNPPQEKRAKQILNTELESDTEKIQKEAEAKGIIFPSSVQKNLKTLPLYDNEKQE